MRWPISLICRMRGGKKKLVTTAYRVIMSTEFKGEVG